VDLGSEGDGRGGEPNIPWSGLGAGLMLKRTKETQQRRSLMLEAAAEDEEDEEVD